MDQPAAVITGAGRGIGRATAVELARRGFRLAVASRNADELAETLRLAAAPADVDGIAVPADVSRPADVERLVRTAVERFGRVDVIAHCAGLAPAKSIVET